MSRRIGRRALLGWGAALPFVVPRRLDAQAAPSRTRLRLGPYLCDPRPEAMGFFLELLEGPAPTVRVVDERDGRTYEAAFRLDARRLGRVDVDGLLPERGYHYAILDGARVVASGRFRTPPRSPNRRVRLALAADIHRGSKPYTVFDRIRDAQPTALFCLGDQVYADAFDPPIPATEDAYRALYPDNWDDASLAACWAEVPTLLAWDDHEIWNDYDGTTYAERFAPAAAAADAYQFARNPGGLALGRRWFEGRIGPCAYFVLDLRSHRAGNAAPDVRGKSILGPRQRRALVRFLRETRAPLKLLLSPSSFHDATTTGTDAFAIGFRAERDFLFRVLADPSVGDVVLVSGDMHWPAVIRHDMGGGRVIHELQCTPVAAFSRPPPSEIPPSMLYVGDGSSGFGRLDVDATGPRVIVDFAWIDASGATRYALRIPLRPESSATPAPPRTT